VASLKEQRKEAAELLAYLKQLAVAAAAANDAQTRDNLRGVLEQRKAQYAQLTAEIQKGDAAARGAADKLGAARGRRIAAAATSTVSNAVGPGAARLYTAAATGSPGAAATLTGLAGPAGAVVDAFKQLVSVSSTLGGALAPFAQAVQAFDPGLAQRFAMALEDLSASLGRSFTPVIEAGTKFADVLNGVFTSLEPVLKPVVEEVAGLLKDFGQTYVAAVLPSFKALLPAVQQLAAGLRPLVEVFGETMAQYSSLLGELVAAATPLLQGILPPLAEAFRGFHAVVQDVIAHMRAAVQTLKYIIDTWNQPGAWAPERIQRTFSQALESARQPALRPLDPTAPRTSASRPAHVTGIEDIGRNARVAAFSARSPEERSASILERMWERMREWQFQQGRDPADEARRNRDTT
jgi:phage-related protein